MDEDTENNDMENQDEITKLLADTEAINTIFNEPANLLKDLMDSFGSKSYESTLESGSKVLGIMNEPTEQFIKLGMAFSISAAAQWVSNLGEVGVDITKAEDILSKAKDQFLGGDFPKVNETIGEVRDIIPELEKDQKDAAFEAISQTERLIEEVGKVGAGIDDADGDLQEDNNILESGKYLDVARLAKKS